VQSAAGPSAQKRNDIGADVILAKKFNWLVCRRITLVSEGGDSLLPCRHALSISPVVKDLVRGYGAAVQHSHVYNVDRRRSQPAKAQWHLSQITDGIEASERGQHMCSERKEKAKEGRENCVAQSPARRIRAADG